MQMLGALFVIIGIIISLVPQIPTHNNPLEFSANNWYWPLIFLLGVVPAVLMNIFEEWIFFDIPKFNITYLLAMESLIQFLTVALFFWVDIIPGFGTSSSISQWWSSFVAGISCFFTPLHHGNPDDCKACAGLGILFTLAYTIQYIFSSLLMKYASANYQAIVSAASPPLGVLFWFIFPSLLAFVGSQTSTEILLCDLFSLLPIVVGIIVYRWFEPPDEHKRTQEHEDEVVFPTPTPI